MRCNRCQGEGENGEWDTRVRHKKNCDADRIIWEMFQDEICLENIQERTGLTISAIRKRLTRMKTKLRIGKSAHTRFVENAVVWEPVDNLDEEE